MKTFLKKILPWHIRRSLAAARNFYRARKPPFEGIYAQFSDVGSRSMAWHSGQWAESCRFWAEKAKRQIGASIPENPPFSKSLLPVCVSLLRATGTRDIRILDFGGAAGIDYGNLLASLGGKLPGIRYHVVDTIECCEAGMKVWAGNPDISFSPGLPDATESFDIVYSSGAIHLDENFRELMRKFSNYNPTLIVFCKTSMYDGPSFVRRQINMGKGFENPQWALGVRDVEEALGKYGYTLTFRGFSEDLHNVDNYDESHKVGRTANLLFTSA